LLITVFKSEVEIASVFLYKFFPYWLVSSPNCIFDKEFRLVWIPNGTQILKFVLAQQQLK